MSSPGRRMSYSGDQRNVADKPKHPEHKKDILLPDIYDYTNKV